MSISSTTRRRITGAVVASGVLLGGLIGPATTAVAADTVTIPDAGFAACLSSSLGKAAGTTAFATTELAALAGLYCDERGITNLEGAQYLTSVEELDLSKNQITDLSPLSGLNQLTDLFLTQNQITSLSPLAGVPNLSRLVAPNNQISDLSPVSGLSKLARLSVSNNRIMDVSTVAAVADVSASNQTPTLSLSQGVTTRVPLRGFQGEVPWYIFWDDELGFSDQSLTPTKAGTYEVEFEDWDAYFTGVLTITVTATDSVTTAVPTISGQAKIGSVLTANAGNWSPAGTSLAYQWFRDGSEISGATGTTYQVKASDAGSKLKVQVTGSASGFQSASATSAATSKVPYLGTIKIKSAKLSGKAKVGAKLKITIKGVKPKGVKVKYAWGRGTTQISGASKSTYKVVKADKGKYLTGVVILTKSGYKQVVKYTKSVKIK